MTCDPNMSYAYENPSENFYEFVDAKYCLYNSASFSTNGDFYVLECLGDKIPTVTLKSEKNSNLERNDDLIFI